MEPFIDVTEEEERHLFREHELQKQRQRAARNEDDNASNDDDIQFSPEEAFNALRTRSQRTLKRHKKSALVGALDTLLHAFTFTPNHTLLAEFSKRRRSQVKQSQSRANFDVDNNDEDDSNDENSCVCSLAQFVSYNQTNHELVFDFEDTFRRHVVHAICEFYDLVSYSYTCQGGSNNDDNDSVMTDSDSQQCFGCKSYHSHRVTVVHARRGGSDSPVSAYLRKSPNTNQYIPSLMDYLSATKQVQTRDEE